MKRTLVFKKVPAWLPGHAINHLNLILLKIRESNPCVPYAAPQHTAATSPVSLHSTNLEPSQSLPNQEMRTIGSRVGDPLQVQGLRNLITGYNRKPVRGMYFLLIHRTTLTMAGRTLQGCLRLISTN